MGFIAILAAVVVILMYSWISYIYARVFFEKYISRDEERTDKKTHNTTIK